MDDTHRKFDILKSDLCKFGKAAVAFSGGVDSVFLLKTAQLVLGENVLALTARLRSVPEAELREAGEFCAKENIAHKIIGIDELALENFAGNPPDRCYYCKREIMTRLLDAAGDFPLVEGSNADDRADYRPGVRALRELGVRSPLLDAGLTKAEIRTLSRELGLPTWDKPAYACLSSRIPCGEEITEEKLRRVERSEALLMSLGFREVRVRCHGQLARIEARPDQIEELCRPDLRAAVSSALKSYGFRYVSLDLDGYRRGSLNPTQPPGKLSD